MRIIRTFIMSCLCGTSILAIGADSDYAARKRLLHEQATGEKLDANGRVIREQKTTNARPKLMMATAAKASSPLSVSNVKISQRKDSKLVDVTYDLSGGSGGRCDVTAEFCDDTSCIWAETYDGDIGEGIAVGKGKKFTWNAGTDWPGEYSEKVNVTVRATESEIPAWYATVKVKWSSFGGRDLDICGYWVDRPTVKVGWSWGTGSPDDAYRSIWHGDNTEGGPEIIDVGVDPSDLPAGTTTRKYRIHFNYYGSLGSSAKATVEVTGPDGTKLSETQSTSKRLGTKANSSDPCITITFDANGKPIAITKGR